MLFSKFNFLTVVILLFCSCTKDSAECAYTVTQPNDLEAISYFKEVALGFDSNQSPNVTRKWFTDMKIYIDGSPVDTVLAKVVSIITEINQLTSDGFQIEIVADSASSNCYLFFGNEDDFFALFPETRSNTSFDLAFFSVRWNNNEINDAKIFINNEDSTLEQRFSVLREEITQVTGLTRDSPLYPNSIFYDIPTDAGYAQEYSALDRELIKLLYHPLMEVGLDENEVDCTLRQILLEQ